MPKALEVIKIKNSKVQPAQEPPKNSNDSKGTSQAKVQELLPEKPDTQAEKKRDAKIAELASAVERLEDQLHKVHDQVSYSQGFYAGRKYIVSTAEEILCKSNHCKTREELATSGKLPAFWVATLVLCLDDPPGVLSLSEKKVGLDEF